MRRPYTLGRCDCCGGNRLLKYAKRTHCCRYRCQKAAAALLAAANEDAEDDLAPTFAKSIEFILGQRFCDPEELNDEKRRNILPSSDFKRCYLIDGIFATVKPLIPRFWTDPVSIHADPSSRTVACSIQP